jgi:hypothetical protein
MRTKEQVEASEMTEVLAHLKAVDEHFDAIRQKLRDRMWTCEECGAEHGDDVTENAAQVLSEMCFHWSELEDFATRMST